MAGRGATAGVSARTRADRAAADRATDREVGVVAAILEAGSEKAAAHRLGLSHSTLKHHLANARSKVGAETTAQLVWILAARLPEPERSAQEESSRFEEANAGRSGMVGGNPARQRIRSRPSGSASSEGGRT